jgi:hypothetical protein
VLLVYGEATFDGVRHGGFGLHDYDKVGLATIDGGEPAELALIFRKLKSRAVVIWPGAHDEGFAYALGHASLMAEAGAAAVGLVETPENDTPEGRAIQGFR